MNKLASTLAKAALLIAPGMSRYILTPSPLLSAALALAFLGAANGCSNAADSNGGNAIPVLDSTSCPAPASPPVQALVSTLIQKPPIADGTYVSITGHLCTGIEKSGLYETPTCAASAKSGLWVSGVSGDVQFNGERVEIVGRFDSTQSGHLGQWPGTVCVYSIRLTEPGARFTFLRDAATRKQ